MDDHTEAEREIAEHKHIGEEGVMLWCPFNSLLNSSTRCELAAAILAMLPGMPMHIGRDNAAVVRKSNEIARHFEENKEACSGKTDR